MEIENITEEDRIRIDITNCDNFLKFLAGKLKMDSNQNSSEFCRICLEGDSEENPLYSFCHCDGSVKLLHEE